MSVGARRQKTPASSETQERHRKTPASPATPLAMYAINAQDYPFERVEALLAAGDVKGAV